MELCRQRSSCGLRQDTGQLAEGACAGLSPNGPWKCADNVPKEIYTIPPSSPVYNVSYVIQTNAIHNGEPRWRVVEINGCRRGMSRPPRDRRRGTGHPAVRPGLSRTGPMGRMSIRLTIMYMRDMMVMSTGRTVTGPGVNTTTAAKGGSSRRVRRRIRCMGLGTATEPVSEGRCRRSGFRIAGAGE